MIQEIGLFLIVFHSVLSTSTTWGNSCWISSIQITEFFGQLPPLGWRTVWVLQGFSFLIVKFCLGNSDSISCFIASSTVNLPMVALPRCCCSAVQSIFCSYQTTAVFVKVSRDTFHFPWTRKFSFCQNTKNNGVLQGNFCIFTCPKDWHFSWKMNIRMSVQNLTIPSPGSLFFNQ